MVLALCLGMTPMTARADGEHDHDGWTGITSLPSEAGSYYLTQNIEINATWNVPGEVNLCLNGHGIRKTGSGSVIAVGSGATLNLYDCGTATHYFDVYSPEGLATNVNDTSGTKSFTGGYITGGDATLGGVLVNGGTFTMNGGSIIGNRVTPDGNRGGGVSVESGQFTMDGGAIRYNYAQNCGGGVAVRGGIFTLKEGEISYNQVTHAGGAGVAIREAGQFNLYGGSIIHNNMELAWEQGGVDAGTKTQNGFNIKGAPVVQDNYININNGATECNVTLRDSAEHFTLDGALTEGANIGIYSVRTFTSGWSTYMNDVDPAEYFTSDNNAYDVILSGTEVALGAAPVASVTVNETTTNYTAFEGQDGALGHWTTGSTLTLLKDVTTTSTITVSGTKTLDLNGHGIRMTGSGNVISVGDGANLTLNDSDATAQTHRTHKFTVPENDAAGLATLNETSGTYTITGGYITGGSTASGSGGGVCVNGGTLTMNGGTVIGNTAKFGGGVYVCDNGTFRLNGGAITGNTAQGSGGGTFNNNTDSKTLTYTFENLHAGSYTLKVEWTESEEPKELTRAITVPIPPEGGT